MIDPKELRIGNWVIAYKKKIQVPSVGNDGIDLVGEDGGSAGALIPKEDIRPIPITARWLVRMYFTKSRNNTLLLPTGEGCAEFEPVKEDGTLILYFGEYNNEYCEFYQLGQPFRYVHQIQNLYHVLAGKELEIKEASK